MAVLFIVINLNLIFQFFLFDPNMSFQYFMINEFMNFTNYNCFSYHYDSYFLMIIQLSGDNYYQGLSQNHSIFMHLLNFYPKFPNSFEIIFYCILTFNSLRFPSTFL